MKRCVLTFAVLFVLALCFSIFYAQTGLAEGGERPWSVGVYPAVVVLTGDEFEDAVPAAGFYVDYLATENIGLEVAADLTVVDFVTTIGGRTGDVKGDLVLVPMSGTVKYMFTDMENCIYYIGGGITYMVIEGDAAGTISPGGNTIINFDNALGGHICGGLDYNIGDRFVINIDGKYTMAQSSTSEDVEVGIDTSRDVGMDNFAVRLGLAYKF